MVGWRDRVSELLYEGERVSESVEFDDATVVVTGHRVLAFTPEMDGANFRTIDRPNVAGVDTGAQSERGLLERGVRYGVIGAVLLVAGLVVDFGSIVGSVDLTGSAASGRIGVGGIMGAMQGMLDLLRDLDRLLRLFGALAVLLALVVLGVYWYTREPTLVIEVAGDDDVHVPRSTGASECVQRLQTAVAPDGRPEP
jgi:hypothetical protein